jgi:putative transposase
MKKRFTEAQIVGFLREADAGVAVKDLCRKIRLLRRQLLPLAEQVRRHERVGCEVLKELEIENTRLKKLLADALLENEVTREALRRTW